MSSSSSSTTSHFSSSSSSSSTERENPWEKLKVTQKRRYTKSKKGSPTSCVVRYRLGSQEELTTSFRYFLATSCSLLAIKTVEYDPQPASTRKQIPPKFLLPARLPGEQSPDPSHTYTEYPDPRPWIERLADLNPFPTGRTNLRVCPAVSKCYTNMLMMIGGVFCQVHEYELTN